jgi:hypothetical protein
MASQRQIQDHKESTQEDSIENGAALQELSDQALEKRKKAKESTKSANSKSDNLDLNYNSKSVKKLDALSLLLQGDLSNMDVDAGIKMVDELRSLVKKSKRPEVEKLAPGMKELSKLLQRKKPNKNDLGELLTELGDQTSNIAAEAELGIQGPLQNLGKQLLKVGLFLGKAEDSEHRLP